MSRLGAPKTFNFCYTKYSIHTTLTSPGFIQLHETYSYLNIFTSQEEISVNPNQIASQVFSKDKMALWPRFAHLSPDSRNRYV